MWNYGIANFGLTIFCIIEGNVFLLVALSLMTLLLLMVPQGSVLGPLLFRLYVNDFSNCSKLFDFHICADDTNIFYANRSLSELEVAINNLKSVASLIMANKLSLNIDKTNFIIFRPPS